MGINKIVYNGGTLIDLTGDTVTADKLAQGYTAHDRTGTVIIGTATGGGGGVTQDQDGFLVLDSQPGSSVSVEALSVTQNGTYTAPTGKAYSPVTVNVSGGGAQPALITGTFVTSSESGVQYVDIPYSGNGYPISAVIEIVGGYLNPSSAYASLVQRYAVGCFVVTKSLTGVAPSWSGSVTENYAAVESAYKNSASNPSTFTTTSAQIQNYYSATDASENLVQCVRFYSRNRLSLYIASTSFGLKDSTTYSYRILYSE